MMRRGDMRHEPKINWRLPRCSQAPQGSAVEITGILSQGSVLSSILERFRRKRGND